LNPLLAHPLVQALLLLIFQFSFTPPIFDLVSYRECHQSN